MVERQDIDALLVGALYGELTPADEARLSAHLESHPGDRSALDGLKSARAAVRESRIFELQLDPPQAVSALLLQEAARRAPKPVVHDDREDRPESWFARFVRSFTAHPAMAAAATFVVVIGVAGTLYMRQGSDELVADQRATEPQAVATPPAPPQSQPTTTAAAGSAAYAVALDEPKTGNDNSNRDQEAPLAKPKPAVVASPAPERAHGNPVADPMASRKSIAVHTPERVPKDMDAYKGAMVADDEDQKLQKEEESRARPATAPGGGGATSGPVAAYQTPPPPPAMTVGKAAPAPAKTDEAFTWAQSQHQLLIATVKGGKCQDAGKIAIGIRNRAPDYYNSYVASDRNLKSCMQYITDAADKDAERSSKLRAAKRADTNETK